MEKVSLYVTIENDSKVIRLSLISENMCLFLMFVIFKKNFFRLKSLKLNNLTISK